MLNAYNVVWSSPSRDASESMPCGGGDKGDVTVKWDGAGVQIDVPQGVEVVRPAL